MAISGILVAILYTIFALGIVKRALATWNFIDLIFSSLDFVFTLAVSIATLAACSNRQAMDYVPPVSLNLFLFILLVFLFLISSCYCKDYY